MTGHKLSNKNHIHIHIGDKEKKRKRRRHRTTGGRSRGGGVYITNQVSHSAPVMPLFNRPQTLDTTLGDEREKAKQNPLYSWFLNSTPTNAARTEFKGTVPAPAKMPDFTPQNSPARVPGPFSSPNKRDAPFQSPQFEIPKKQTVEPPVSPPTKTSGLPTPKPAPLSPPPKKITPRVEPEPVKEAPPEPVKEAAPRRVRFENPAPAPTEAKSFEDQSGLSAPAMHEVHSQTGDIGPFSAHEHLPRVAPRAEERNDPIPPPTKEPAAAPANAHRPRIVQRPLSYPGQYEVFSQSGYRRGGPFSSNPAFTPAKYDKHDSDEDLKQAQARRHGPK